jgi:N-acetylmuramic acid 6-phosphate etherase
VTVTQKKHRPALQDGVFYYTASMSLPPNRGHLATEQQHEHTHALDLISTIDCVSLLSKDHDQAMTAVQCATDSIASFIDALTPRVQKGGRLIYIGCGTSGRLGVLDAAECPPTFQSNPEQIIGLIAGGDASLRTSSEAKEDVADGVSPEYDRIKLTNEDTVLGIAAGGTTPWVIGGLKIAKERGAMTGLITCSEVATSVDYLILLNTGAEPLTGSTRMKAGTATKITLNIITTTLFCKLGKVYKNMMVDLKATNDKLMDRAIRIVSTVCELDRESASTLLSDSGGDVKIAIIMHSCSVDLESATLRLAEAGGNLRGAL